MKEGALKEAVLSIPDHIINQSNESLEKAVKPTAMDYNMRASFWMEFMRVMENGGFIISQNIIRGVMSDINFYNRFLTNHKRLAWMLVPLPDFNRNMNALLLRFSDRLWEIADLPIKKNGKVNEGVARLILSTTKMLKEHVYGMAVQRSENRNMNITASADSIQNMTDMSVLDAKIAELGGVVRSGTKALKQAKTKIKEEPETRTSKLAVVEGDIESGKD